MKKPYQIIFVLFFFFMTKEVAGDNIRLQLKEKQELVYEYSLQKTQNVKSLLPRKNVQTIKFLICVEKIENGKILFTARSLSITKAASQNGDTGFYDTGFPQLVKGSAKYNKEDLSEVMLHQVPFNFEFNLNTGNFQLTNRIDILEGCHLSLNNKAYSEELRNATILNINKTEIQKYTELFLMPFIFLNTDTEQTQVNNTKLNLNFSVSRGEKNEIYFKSTIDSLNRKISCAVDSNKGFVIRYSEESRKEGSLGKSNAFIKEERTVTGLNLRQFSFLKSNNLIVCGHIHNPVSKQLTLYTLNNEFGTEFDNQTVLLDKSGNFRIEAPLKSKGLVIVSNPNNNRNVEGPHLILYAEPGDSIYVDARFQQKQFKSSKYFVGDSLFTKYEDFVVPAELFFSGNRKREAELIGKFQWQNGFIPFKIINNSIFPDRYTDDALNYLDALSKLDALILDARGSMDPGTCNFLKNELQAFLLSQICKKIPPVLTNGGTSISTLKPSIPQSEKNKVETLFDTLKVHNIFNDYGCFSREFIEDYVKYKFKSVAPIGNFRMGYVNLGYLYDPEQFFHFTKLVLYGSALYREGARQLYDYTISTSRFMKEDDFHPFVDETIDLMMKRCNDERFVKALENIRKAQGKWDDLFYLPEIRFLNLKRELTSLHSFLNQKPVVLFSSKDWSNSRYDMDEYATKHPEITFILLNEGSNFDLWKEWNDRAAPVANQLFLENDSLNLEDIFQQNILKYIIYSASGKRISIENSLSKAVSTAKESLNPVPKELNKSTMMGIIWFLGGSLFVLFIALFAFKIRTRRKMRKQEQEKRLQELQLSAIRAQMNPHFLFNSLNSVQNLIQKDRAHEAHLYLADFAGLIRKVLNNSQREEISLAEELETLNQYIHLEKLRFDFEYELNVCEEIDQNNFMVPSMILQPIIENAITHGLQHKTGNKKLMVSVVKAGTNILISIEDNGIGLDAARKLKTGSNGVGLKMNEERLKIMDEKYGGKYSFRIVDLFEQGREGTRVEISIPDEI